MRYLDEDDGQHRQPGKPAGHEGQPGRSRVVGVQDQHHSRNYRYRRQCDDERERYQLAEQRPGVLALRGACGGMPAEQVGQPAEIDEHVIALSVRRSW